MWLLAERDHPLLDAAFDHRKDLLLPIRVGNVVALDLAVGAANVRDDLAVGVVVEMEQLVRALHESAGSSLS